MIISNLFGGLGNQMFQYAVCRSLALRNSTTFRLDVTRVESYDVHQGFELHRVFAGPMEIASETDIQNILGWQSSPTIRRILMRQKLTVFRRQGLVVEPHFEYWAGLSSAPRDSYLVGYWQSEKYFKDVEQIIRADLTFRTPLSAQNEQIANLMAQGSAVSLHVRRGDYVSNPKTNATHGTCSLEYYQAAIRCMADKVGSPQFYIFSDDIQWVKEHLKLEFPCLYIEHNTGNESYNDMRLMSLCQHHIIANSSFSWWGAWLNASEEKLVIAPQKWFVNDRFTKDLYPDSWVKL